MTTKTEPRIIERSDKVNGYSGFLVVYYKDGERKRKTCKTRKKADAFLRELNDKNQADDEARRTLEKKIGEKAKQLDSDSLIDATRALGILKGITSLETAARYWLENNNPDGGKITVDDAIKEYLAEATADDLRPASIQDLETRLSRLSDAFGSKHIHEIKKRAIQNWSRSKHTAKQNGEPISKLTRKHYLTVAGGLFNWAVDQEYLTESPLWKKSRSRSKSRRGQDETIPEIITVAEVQKVMLAAQEHDPSMVPALAIGFFAGVRTNELRQLDWKNVNLADKRITIPPEIAKKRSVRHIDIADNLAAWLATHRQDSGLIAPDGKKWRYRFDKVRNKAEIERWPHNAMRHCFATFYLLKSDDANKTALQLGHRDTDLLFRHYRALATKEDAVKFWSITPKAKGNVVQFTKAG